MEIGLIKTLSATDDILEIKAENSDLKTKNNTLFGIAVGCLVIGTIAYYLAFKAMKNQKEKDVILKVKV